MLHVLSGIYSDKVVVVVVVVIVIALVVIIVLLALAIPVAGSSSSTSSSSSCSCGSISSSSSRFLFQHNTAVNQDKKQFVNTNKYIAAFCRGSPGKPYGNQNM